MQVILQLIDNTLYIYNVRTVYSALFSALSDRGLKPECDRNAQQSKFCPDVERCLFGRTNSHHCLCRIAPCILAKTNKIYYTIEIISQICYIIYIYGFSIFSRPSASFIRNRV